MNTLMRIFVFHVLFVFSLSVLSFSEETGNITLIPLGPPDGEFGPIGFEMRAPWMDGWKHRDTLP